MATMIRMSVRGVALSGVLTRALVDDLPDDVLSWPFAPPADWFVRGPRGGIYEAIGPISASLDDTSADVFIRDQVRFTYRSEDRRYLRPGSRRYRYAQDRLAGRPTEGSKQ
jgi:hypothetical protein